MISVDRTWNQGHVCSILHTWPGTKENENLRGEQGVPTTFHKFAPPHSLKQGPLLVSRGLCTYQRENVCTQFLSQWVQSCSLNLNFLICKMGVTTKPAIPWRS